MQRVALIIISMFNIQFIACDIEPYIVNGVNASIKDFPHSVFVTIRTCEGGWICGASILNEKIVLTAGHCVEQCSGKRTEIAAYVGHAQNMEGKRHIADRYYLHKEYDTVEVDNDIALIRVKKPFKFKKGVKRVAIMMDPPGWGMTNENINEFDPALKYIKQYVLKADHCKNKFKKLPKSAICVTGDNKDSYTSRGDSGSALVVRDYIQIGIVSYKVPSISSDVIIYTDVGYFYNWITEKSEMLYCS